MNIKVLRAKQYNSTYKYILLINGEAVVIAKSETTVNKCIAYLSDNSVELSDGKVKKQLDKYKMSGGKE